MSRVQREGAPLEKACFTSWEAQGLRERTVQPVQNVMPEEVE